MHEAPYFESAPEGESYIRERKGDADLAAVLLTLSQDHQDEVFADLHRYIVASNYPDTRETMGLIQYVWTPDKDESGNNIFANVQYDNHGHQATLGGHTEPIGDAGEGHRIVWQTYMD